MTLRDILNKFKVTAKVGFKSSFIDFSIEFNDIDKIAAWDLYIELITRVATKELEEGSGDERAALTSIYSLFATTREVLRKNGPRCQNFAKVAVVILNEVIRPFTSKWHGQIEHLSEEENKKEFRKDLEVMHEKIKEFTETLAQIAGINGNIFG